MYIRNSYINQLTPLIKKPVIKVITGMRRVGKSCILSQLQAYLYKSGISKKHVLSINMELLEFDFIKNYEDLHTYIKRLLPNKTTQYYVFVDEIQEIEGWEKAIISLFTMGNFDLFITGSNAHLLSSELATRLSGRYIETAIYPLSFKEFIEFNEYDATKDETFQRYLKFGGLPGLHHFSGNENEAYQYISAIYDTILLKDIVERFNIRNVRTLQNIAQFLFDNISHTFSAKKIKDYLKSQQISLSVDTVQNYTEFLSSAFLLHRVGRFDIKGKKQMEIYEKYYLNDLGIKHALLGYRDMDIADLLENVVYLELRRQGYSVKIGKVGVKEVDFIASMADKRFYIQVTYLLASEQTKEREISVFNEIPDHYPKILLSMDKIKSSDSIEGVHHIHIVDFLLGKRSLP